MSNWAYYKYTFWNTACRISGISFTNLPTEEDRGSPKMCLFLRHPLPHNKTWKHFHYFASGFIQNWPIESLLYSFYELYRNIHKSAQTLCISPLEPKTRYHFPYPWQRSEFNVTSHKLIIKQTILQNSCLKEHTRRISEKCD